MSAPRPVLALSVLACHAAACSGGTVPPPRHRLEAPAEPSALFATPARWAYHPPPPVNGLAAVPIDGGGCVFTADGGQRWSTPGRKQTARGTVCIGKAEVSPFVAPEDLRSAIRRSDGSWVFIGEAGTLYEAQAPLTPFTRTVLAPEPFMKLAGKGSLLLGATLEGRVLCWEDATGWRKVPGAPVDARIFDLAVGDGGKVLAIAFPEAVFASEDGGGTWTQAPVPTIGARALGHTQSGDLAVQGLYDSLVFHPGATPPFARTAEKIHPSGASLEIEVGRAPSAAAVQVGRAVLAGDRYYEVIRPENEGEPWLFTRGRMDGRLETTPLPDTGLCSSMRLGARGNFVFSACVSVVGSEIAAEIRRSADAGATFGAPLRLFTPDTDQVSIAVSPEGAALVSGVCRTADDAGTCTPGSPVLVRLSGSAGPAAVDIPRPGSPPNAPSASPAREPTLRASPTSAAQLSGQGRLTAFSADGRSAYFLGRRGKDDRTALFVSRDGGESFSPRSLETSKGVHAPRRNPDEDPSESEGTESFEMDEQSTLLPGEDGTVGMVLMRVHHGNVYVTADDDGRVTQVGGPPPENDGMAFAGYGRRVLAVSASGSESGRTEAWESLDGGVTWEAEAAPESLGRELQRGASTLVCSLGGCLVGDTAARVGWGRGSEPLPAERLPEPPPPTPSVLTPIVCDLSTNTKWSRIESVHRVEHGPTASDIMRGHAAWSMLSFDPRTGALSVTTATLPDSPTGEPRVSSRSMFAAHPAAARFAYDISTQYEGYAAVRVPVPVDARGKIKVGAPMRNVEVAWENYLEGTSARVQIPDAGPFGEGDVVGPDDLQPALISVTAHGLFLRPHASDANDGVEFFLEPGGRAERHTPPVFPAATPAGVPLKMRADGAFVGGELIGVGLFGSSSGNEWGGAVLAHRTGKPSGSAYAFTAQSVLPLRVDEAGLVASTSWGSSSRTPIGIAALIADPQRARAWAHFIGFRSDGTFLPTEPLPTLFDLGDRPKPCSASERATSPRYAVPFFGQKRALFPGMRHPVLVNPPRSKNAVGVDEPITLLTADAVIHGTPSAPCLAAWDATALGRGTLTAVIPGDLAHAWIFRDATEAQATGKGPDRSAALPAVEYRPMACHYDPSAHFPDTVWTEAGTARP